LERQLIERQVVLMGSERPGRTRLGLLWKQFSGSLMWRKWQYAVVMLLAALVVLSVFFLARPQPVNAQEILDRTRDVTSNLQANGIRSFEMVSETTTASDIPNGIVGTADQTGEIRSQLHTWYQETNLWRYEMRFLALPDREPDPRPSVTVADGKAIWSYDPGQNFLQIHDGVFGGAGKGGGPGLYGMNGGVEAVLGSASQCYDPSLVGEGEIIAGRKTHKIFLGPSKCPSVAAAAFNGPQTVWIDRETFFILKREIRDLRNENLIYTMTVTSILYNLEIGPGTFTFTPPEGATILDDRTNP
jgi:outer membrane lipoprotein-sorting protein